MSSFVFLVIGGLIATSLGYLTNQLPAIQAIPGRHGHIFRLMVWIVALSIVLGILQAPGVTLPWLKEVSLILGTLVVIDGVQLSWKCWQYQRRLNKAHRAAAANEPSVILTPEPDSASGLSSQKSSSARPPFRLPGQRTAEYLRRQARRCEEYEVEGHNQYGRVPLLTEVFVPLELQQTGYADVPTTVRQREQIRWSDHPEWHGPDVDIWQLLRRSQTDFQLRQLCILAKGGLGKTTLLRYLTLIYAQQRYRHHRAPKFIPFLIRLRNWYPHFSGINSPSLAVFLTNSYLPTFTRHHQPLQFPVSWVETILTSGKALVMFDGFDEVPPTQRSAVSTWLTKQMGEYKDTKTVFILTSRPKGYSDQYYTATKSALTIFINPFTPAQQADFIRRWYINQEVRVREPDRMDTALDVARQRADDLIQQLETRRQRARQTAGRQSGLDYLAQNPLLLHMLVTLHRFDPNPELPRQRLELYERIVRLQLYEKPRARGMVMLVEFGLSHTLLQRLAVSMITERDLATITRKDEEVNLTIARPKLLDFLANQPELAAERVEAITWLNQIVEVSELLVEREPQEYEFPHASFQGYFAAKELVRPGPETEIFRQNQQSILDNWTQDIWRETVLLYGAQLPLNQLEAVIRAANAQGGEAAQLAALCLQEYPRPEKLSPELLARLAVLETVTTSAKYQTLEALMQKGEWREADQETYRLMITTVGKEEGQWFDRKDLEEFPCEDLLELDRLWVKYSRGKFGFSVQKRIWVEVGGKLDFGEDENAAIAAYKKMSDRNGWRVEGEYISYNQLTFNTTAPTGHLPRASFEWLIDILLGGFGGEGVGSESLFSRIAHCKL